MTQKTILITGCSTGIGYVCAHGLKARGYRVFAAARQDKDVQRLRDEGLEALQLDYSDSASVKACAAEVSRLTGGTLYGLFNNGAYGQPGAVEDITRDVMEEQFAVNFFGWHELTNLCLPMMRKLGEGRIVQCSSLLGLMAFKFRGPYNASKFAMEGLTDTLRLELAPTKIRVSTINPGPIESQFTKNAYAAFLKNVDQSVTHYKAEYQEQIARFTRGGNSRFKLPSEAVLAKLILALERPNPAAHYYVTTPTHVVGIIRRFLPQFLIDRFVHRFSS